MKTEKDWFGKNKHRYKSAKEIIQKEFPGIFDDEHPIPLKVGIHLDLFEKFGKVMSNRHIRIFLRFWTRRGEYHVAMKECGFRCDLNGERYSTENRHRIFSEKRIPAKFRLAA